MYYFNKVLKFYFVKHKNKNQNTKNILRTGVITVYLFVYFIDERRYHLTGGLRPPPRGEAPERLI